MLQLQCLAAVVFLVTPQDGRSPYEFNWTDAQANISVPDPTRPDATPELGYVGLWRTIYGDRDKRKVRPENANALVSRYTGPIATGQSGEDDLLTSAGPTIGGGTGRGRSRTGEYELEFGGFDMRTPRLAAARRATVVQRYSDMPAFEVSDQYIEPEVAAFVWDHELEQVQNDVFAADSYAMAPTSTPRDYLPNVVVSEDEDPDWTSNPSNNNLVLTIAVAVIAVLLFFVIIFMPK